MTPEKWIALVSCLIVSCMFTGMTADIGKDFEGNWKSKLSKILFWSLFSISIFFAMMFIIQITMFIIL